ncbi:hypothetical protein KPH14_012838 [Odynerus spinipes]|uniref:Uncharacterized protein n=1 Tax=Odynerus spinipes TaxID=1348599 RepID=A0AAD9RE39_9HYME|nr:hypothetical protein KPH14_012838 [Odynerus spinipes]
MRLRNFIELKKIIEDELISTVRDERQALRDQGREAIGKIQQENRRTYNKKRMKANIYKRGDLVAIKRTQVAPGSKFSTKYLGPYQVSDVLCADRYAVVKVGEHEGPQATTVSADHLKRWLPGFDDSDTDDESHNNDVIDIEEHRSPMSLQNGRDVGIEKRSGVGNSTNRQRSPILTRSRAAAQRAVLRN